MSNNKTDFLTLQISLNVSWCVMFPSMLLSMALHWFKTELNVFISSFCRALSEGCLSRYSYCSVEAGVTWGNLVILCRYGYKLSHWDRQYQNKSMFALVPKLHEAALRGRARCNTELLELSGCLGEWSCHLLCPFICTDGALAMQDNL